jgi:hypothetical protein
VFELAPLTAEARCDELGTTSRSLTDGREGVSAGGEGAGTLETTVVVTVAAGSGPLVPTIGDDD